MYKGCISVLLLAAVAASAQTINPNQIRPATTNTYVLTTVGGQTVWAPAAGCGPLSGDATSTNCGNGNFVTYTGTTGQAFGYQNIVTNNATQVVAVGSGNAANITSTGGIANADIIGIGDKSTVNVNGSDIIGIGDTSANNIPSVSGQNGCQTGDVIGIGDGSLAQAYVPIQNVIGIGDGAANNYGANRTAGCNSVPQPTGIVAIGNGAGSISNANVFSGGPEFSPEDVVAVGDGAGINYGGQSMVAVGTGGGDYLPGSSDVVAIGDGSADGPTNQLAAHPLLPLATVHDVVGIGDASLSANSGDEVIGIGDGSLGCVNCIGLGGAGQTGNSGIDNIAIGDHALPSNTSGSNNIAIGKLAGGNGWTSGGASNPSPGNSNQTGSQNTWIGDNSGPASTTQLSNTVALGFGATPTVSNQTVIGNNSITAVTIFGVGTGCLSASSGVITGSGSACGSGGGGGSNVTVNGGSTLTTANFGTLPAAGSNGLNVTWQNSGNNVSAEIVGDGVSTHFLNGNGGWTAPAGGGSGTVTSIATTGPITGGTITTSGTIACATCVVASSPGVGIAHFAGSTQTVTSSAVNLASADVTGLLPHANIAATAVTPGSYTNANITVAADGSITAAANGSSGGSVAFSGVTAGTNTNALLVGTGGSFGPTGSGTITATTMPVGGLTGTTLPSSIVTSSLTTVGTIATGTWAGTTIAASHGGTGIANTATLTLGTSNQNWATLGTGIVKNTTTTGAITDATSADVIGLWTGTCSSSTFLRGDGACAAASGSSGISGLTAGFLPIAGSSTTLTANSHIDDGVTTAATLTASEPLAVTGAPGIIMAHATATPGVVGSVVYTVDATTGFGEMNQNNLGLERIAGWNTANTFTANQTAPSFIASGSGAGSVVLTNGTAPSAVASSVQLIPPATVTTAYNYIFPAGPLNSANPVLEQCTGTATTLSCAPASGSVSTALVTGTYSDVSFNNSHVATAHIGLEADSSGTDKNLYEDVPTGGVFNFRVNSVSGIEAGVASGNYWAIEWGAAPTAAHPSIQADVSGTDPAFYLVAGTGGQVQMKSASLPLATFVPGSAPTGACSGNYFTFSATDGKGTYCNGTTQVNKF